MTVTLLVGGRPLDRMRVTQKGRTREEPIPKGALPDCAACDKPELDPSNYETVLLYRFAQNQQTFSVADGKRLGLRAEALIAILDELCRQGKVRDRERAFKRVWALDEVVNTAWNTAHATPPPPKDRDSE